RQAYAALRGEPKQLSRVIVGSAAGFFTMLRAVLRLAGRPVPASHEELVQSAAALVGFPGDGLVPLVRHASGGPALKLGSRADLVPNLVETVKGYAKQEQTVFGEVSEARAKLAGAVQGGNLQEMAQANAALTAPLGRLLAIAENYPQLKSNENFRALQDQLEGTENRIAVARQDYNDAVNRYNAYIRRFPQVLTAKVLGKGPRPYFELET